MIDVIAILGFYETGVKIGNVLGKAIYSSNIEQVSKGIEYYEKGIKPFKEDFLIDLSF